MTDEVSRSRLTATPEQQTEHFDAAHRAAARPRELERDPAYAAAPSQVVPPADRRRNHLDQPDGER